MRLVLRLAIADALHDRVMFACAALTVAAVLLPLLLLLGLKTGVVERLVADLRADPGATELRLRGNVALPPAWFEVMRARPDVGFVVPRVRTFGAAIQYARADDPIRARSADFMASGARDPLLGGLAASIVSGQVVVSQRVAEEASVRPGDELVLWRPLPRGAAPAPRVERRVVVAAIAPPGASGQRHIFGTAELAGLLEDVAEREGAPDAAGQRSFAGFRLYARDIADVAALQRHVEAQGFEVETNAGRIAWVFTMDRNLTILFLMLVACAALGVAGALAATLWGNVARKRRSLSLLRLMGLSARRLAWFPLIQAALVALVGAALASLATLGAAAAINAGFGGAYGIPSLARILPWHLGVATAGVLVLSLLAGAIAVRPVLRIAPAEGLRGE